MRYSKRNIWIAVGLGAFALLYIYVSLQMLSNIEELVTEEYGKAVAVDSSGNTYIFGEFSGPTDFDPGPAIVQHTSKWDSDNFLIKFDLNGDFLWVRTWGCEWDDIAWDMALDSNGNVYTAGSFNDTVDLDPGSGVDEYISRGTYYTYLSKFDSDGNFVWARTWQGSSPIQLTVGNSSIINIYGQFDGTVDFDPGPGVEERTANGWATTFNSSFDSDGNFLSVHTGGIDHGSGVAFDSSGNRYITGYFNSPDFFKGPVDLDPGLDVVEPVSKGATDIYLSKFNSAGSLIWTYTWGGTDSDFGGDIALDSNCNSYLTGTFSGTVDFDPGTGVEERTANRFLDSYFCKFDSDGNFIWVRTWGGAPWSGKGLTIDANDIIYVTGSIARGANRSPSVDLDPGPGMDMHTLTGSNDIFLSKFDTNGDFISAITFGGENLPYSSD